MNVLELFEASSETWAHKGKFYKCYCNLPKKQWNRIVSVSKIISENGISPSLLKVDNETQTLTWQRAIPFVCSSNEPPKGVTLSIKEIQNQIRQQIQKLHSLGYVHGDLHIANICYLDGKIFLTDFDTTILVSEDGDSDWFRYYIENAYDEINNIEEFKDYELNNFWRTDFLYP